MLHFLYNKSFCRLTHSQSATMQHSSPFLSLLLLLAASPLLAAAETIYCFGGVHNTNSTYGANLRRLAAVLPSKTASSQGLRASGDVGYWPNRVRASSSCEPPSVNSSSCAACVAAAFREAESACPYGRKVLVLAGNCTLRLGLGHFSRSLGLGEGGFSGISSQEGMFCFTGPTDYYFSAYISLMC
ncbi:hypothetical protein CFC21_086334 [Triticum aestivum]|uniref:Gnk2-homologous domain-containing protein n=2 Tax=Triticum aestivum TaxID=4565 RepID=A0A9R1L9J8_WHEAT|nr:hypothetical protein CFC21_086332 [Triticum aestivum]KAF7082464.1 hypothetical protein CFC21_086333 [Triticum aestivum]KAF7082465.1 hypothetical protein CFC21_086334 [Triticum aestivum]